MARFEVFILNYNGAHFLKECLDSLNALELGDHQLSLNIVDNGSQDCSQEMVRIHFPTVNFIALGRNFGFSRGNNLGVAKRDAELKKLRQTADYYIFLNNDTKVDPHWLLSAAEVLEGDKKVGMVGSKSIFYDRFAALEIKTSPTFRPTHYGSDDSRELSVFLNSSLQGSNLYCDFRRTKLIHASNEEGDLEQRGRWLYPDSKLFLALHDPAKSSRITITIENRHPEKIEQTVTISLINNSSKSVTKTVCFGKPERFSFSFSPSDYLDVIQNAGSYVTDTWEGGDRGFLEIDNGQFDSSFSPDAICGVSCFIRAELFKKLAGFDEHYFAYYEDTDLSLRAKAKGYQLQYVPNSILRHIHCGSGVEHSDYFNENVSFSHLIFSSKFMARSLWREKLSACKQNAKREFEAFCFDGLIGNKPHLRAYCRYLKGWPYFAANRLRNICNKSH